MNPHPLAKPKEKPVPKNFPKGILPCPLPATATHQYHPRDILELPLKYNQRLHILEAKGDWWYIARSMDGKEGWVLSSTPPLPSTSQANETLLIGQCEKGTKLVHQAPRFTAESGHA